MKQKKGFIFPLPLVTFMVVIVTVVLFSALLSGLLLYKKGFGKAPIAKELYVELIHEPVSTQDALLSLMEMKDDNDITFNKALVYAVYEDTTKPRILKHGVGCPDDLCVYSLESVAKDYLDFVCRKNNWLSEGKYWLFLYNPNIHYNIKTIATNTKPDEFDKKPYGQRASIPIKPENYWLVLYVR